MPPKPESGRETAERSLAVPDQGRKPNHPRFGDALDDDIPF
jgi:hypothetical protein